MALSVKKWGERTFRTRQLADGGGSEYGRLMLNDLLRSLPYLIHTNRELGLMLSGNKPLASFIDGRDRFPEVVNRYLRLFDRQVAQGRLIRCDHFSEVFGQRTYISHRVLFALPGEEWRMQAMIDLMSGNEPWTPEHERREGELLGYDDWMNDYWLELVYKKLTVR